MQQRIVGYMGRILLIAWIMSFPIMEQAAWAWQVLTPRSGPAVSVGPADCQLEPALEPAGFGFRFMEPQRVDTHIPLLILPLLLFGVLAMAAWIWMLVECATKEPPGYDKVVWTLIIIFTHVIGAVIYYYARRPKRIQETGR
ncbi:MAG: PLD nuclease N-terminal domain-containing protein [bacterium]